MLDESEGMNGLAAVFLRKCFLILLEWLRKDTTYPVWLVSWWDLEYCPNAREIWCHHVCHPLLLNQEHKFIGEPICLLVSTWNVIQQSATWYKLITCSCCLRSLCYVFILASTRSHSGYWRTFKLFRLRSGYCCRILMDFVRDESMSILGEWRVLWLSLR
jgi:hypothetical protein